MSMSARLRTYRVQWRATQLDADGRARSRLRADEAAITGPQRRGLPLGEAWRTFWRHPSPWLISAFLIGGLVARLSVGDWRLSDAILPVVMVASFPFYEWVIHVCILHWRPRRFAGLTIDPMLARDHRAHHADPRNIPLVFIPWRALIWIIASDSVLALLLSPRLGLGLSFLVVLGVLGITYEWVHYLIHSDYRPRSSAYRSVWRSHRLHHYKNEHYWFTVTTAGTADRLLGTYPDPQRVATSPTVKDLHARESA